MKEEIEKILFRHRANDRGNSELNLFDDKEKLEEQDSYYAGEILKIIAKHVKNKSFEFMEACDPDCDEVRHALHEGGWQHMTRMDEWADSLIEAE